MPGEPGPQRGDHLRQLRLGVLHRDAAARQREDGPEGVPRGRRAPHQRPEQASVRLIPGEQVVPRVVDRRRERVERVEDHPRFGGQAVTAGAGRHHGHGCETVEVLALGEVEREGGRDRVQHLHRRVDLPALLEPGVPRDADPGELGHLFPPQARRPPAEAGRQAHILGGDPLSAAAQE